MTAEVRPITLTKENAKKLVNELAQNSAHILMPEELKLETWKSRVTNLQVQKCLAHGEVISDPYLDNFDCWVCKLQLPISGILIDVTVSIMWKEEKRRLIVREVIVLH